MLIYGEVQHGGVQRATLHTAGWISLALMVMSLAPSLSRAAIFCLGSEEFEAACEARVQQIHDATEEGRIIVDQLRGSDNIHVVLESNRNSNTMFSVNGYDGGSCGQIAEARGLPLDCTGAGTGDGSFTEWNPTDYSPFPEDGVARNPTAELLHELYHADLCDIGAASAEKFNGTDADVDEIDASRVENVWRLDQDLDPREKYDSADIEPHDAPESGSSILMLLIAIGALCCIHRFLRLA